MYCLKKQDTEVQFFPPSFILLNPCVFYCFLYLAAEL
uniref:Uncharacterized protein n=1 Tax=Anguilla anguilla TaxID=7936 RepID=A0A0E9UD06_ANGAN